MKRGFTLIELLVVIAIIAILAAILFPVFWKSNAENRLSRIASGDLKFTDGDKDYVVTCLNNNTSNFLSDNDRKNKIVSIMRLTPPVPAGTISDGVERVLSVVLTDGRTVTAMVMIPVGSEIASVSVQPVTAEAPVVAD